MVEKEALARIKINQLLEDAGWRFFDNEKGKANIQLEPNVKITQTDLDGLVKNGTKNGYVDYRTLAKCGDMVLCNDITKLFYSSINGEYIDPQQVNGFIDNSEQIDELQEQINSLEYEQDNNPEIFQYYIISDNLAEILKELTNEIIYYIDFLGVYVWGVTHWGTSWDYVLTNIKIELEGGEND